jgi:catechol 2,3-dioxygenase-like lactoylglutathione lyase family enzyme
MIDHVNLPVSSLQTSRAFYEAALAPLDLPFLMEDGGAVGFGASTWSFGIVQESSAFPALHVAFAAKTREAVRAFYRAALDSGATDNGAPGPRPKYGPGYFAAFVRDPDGHNVEAVCRGADSRS